MPPKWREDLIKKANEKWITRKPRSYKNSGLRKIIQRAINQRVKEKKWKDHESQAE
jgi:hypothetical protein